MPAKFSSELREEMVRYFEEYHHLSISAETAEEFLDSLAEFYLWLANAKPKSEVVEDKIDAAAAPAGGDAI